MHFPTICFRSLISPWARGPTAEQETELYFDENREATAQREVGYLASLTQLAASCDTIVSEAIKIRGLRKAKHQMETEVRTVKFSNRRRFAFICLFFVLQPGGQGNYKRTHRRGAGAGRLYGA